MTNKILTLLILTSIVAGCAASTSGNSGGGNNASPVTTNSSHLITQDAVDVDLNIPAPTDADSDTLTITVSSLPNPSIGSVTLSNGSPLAVAQTLTISDFQNLQFDSVLNATGSSTFVYAASDGTDSINGTATISVSSGGGGNNAPVTTNSSHAITQDALNVALNIPSPTDADADTLTITVTSLPTVSIGSVTLSTGSSLTVSQNLTIAEFLNLQFDSVMNAIGSDTFVYAVSDGTASVNGTAIITVGNVVSGAAVCGANSTCINVVTYDCNLSTIHCVGSGQEFTTIQPAVDTTSAGDTVVVSAGTYRGFRVNNSGANGNPILITTNRNNVIINQAASGGSDNIYISNSNDVIVEGFTVINAPAYGIGAHDANSSNPMERVTVRYNTISDSVSTNIYLSNARNSLILGNIAFDSFNSHGIYVANGGADNVSVIGNVLYNNGGNGGSPNGNGIHFNGDGNDAGDVHTGLIVSDNTIYGNYANGVDGDGVSNSSFSNNLIYENGRNGIRAFVIDAVSGSTNLNMYNNTIADNGGAGIKITQDDGSGGHIFFNNILIGNSSECISVENSNFDANANAYSTGCSFTNSGSGGTSGFTDETTIFSNSSSLFTNAGSDDYSIKLGSPAIDAGLSTYQGITAPSFDIEGMDRNDGNIDMGAYEI